MPTYVGDRLDDAFAPTPRVRTPDFEATGSTPRGRSALARCSRQGDTYRRHSFAKCSKVLVCVKVVRKRQIHGFRRWKIIDRFMQGGRRENGHHAMLSHRHFGCAAPRFSLSRREGAKAFGGWATGLDIRSEVLGRTALFQFRFLSCPASALFRPTLAGSVLICRFRLAPASLKEGAHDRGIRIIAEC